MTTTDNRKWWALYVLCLGTLMVVLDTTIVNVALPSIRTDLGFSGSTLAWVINAYLLTSGGFLLLGGRLGDLFGQRKLFLIGIAAFTLASLACGLASTQWFLILARAIQGIGGAVADAVALSFTMNLFTENHERAKAMGIFGFVAAGGGSIGVLLGGLLTSVNWHWIFLVNVPIGIFVILLSMIYLPKMKGAGEMKHLDIGGAFTVTTSLLLAVYAIVNGSNSGWLSMQTLITLAGSIILFAIFIAIESRVKEPMIPLRLFRLRNIIVSNAIGILWSAAMFAWFFLSALYMQLILHYSPFKVGLAFLPANVIMAVFSVSISAKLVQKYGLKKPLAFGLGAASIGLFLLALAPLQGNYVINLLPAMILLGLGAGIAFNPVLLAAMSDVSSDESGLASGVVNTSFMMGGALGLAVLVSIAASRTGGLMAGGANQLAAINSGYHAAFIAGGICALLGVLLGIFALREPDAIGAPRH
jgi:EmrB/QacA subfamily drug resistance transporter